MSESLGPLLGDGRTAEVYDYGNGQVIKLLLPGLSEWALRDEAMKTASASAAGAPAPVVYGIEEVDGRPGIVFDRAQGILMLDAILKAPHRVRTWAKRLAAAHAEILARRSDQLPDVKEFLAAKISAGSGLTSSEKDTAKDTLLALPDGDRVLHGDFHPLNVFVGDEDTVIDWLDATSGAAGADLARSAWLTSVHVIPPDFPKRWAATTLVRLLGNTYRSAVLDITGYTKADVEAWMLPVLAGRLSEDIEHEEGSLLREVRARL